MTGDEMAASVDGGRTVNGCNLNGGESSQNTNTRDWLQQAIGVPGLPLLR